MSQTLGSDSLPQESPLNALSLNTEFKPILKALSDKILLSQRMLSDHFGYLGQDPYVSNVNSSQAYIISY